MSKISPQKLVDDFNRKYPVGSEVKWTPIANKASMATVKTVKFEACILNGNPVVWFNGKSGCCSIEPQFIIEP